MQPNPPHTAHVEHAGRSGLCLLFKLAKSSQLAGISSFDKGLKRKEHNFGRQQDTTWPYGKYPTEAVFGVIKGTNPPYYVGLRPSIARQYSPLLRCATHLTATIPQYFTALLPHPPFKPSRPPAAPPLWPHPPNPHARTLLLLRRLCATVHLSKLLGQRQRLHSPRTVTPWGPQRECRPHLHDPIQIGLLGGAHVAHVCDATHVAQLRDVWLL